MGPFLVTAVSVLFTSYLSLVSCHVFMVLSMLMDTIFFSSLVRKIAVTVCKCVSLECEIYFILLSEVSWAMRIWKGLAPLRAT